MADFGGLEFNLEGLRRWADMQREVLGLLGFAVDAAAPDAYRWSPEAGEAEMGAWDEVLRRSSFSQ